LAVDILKDILAKVKAGKITHKQIASELHRRATWIGEILDDTPEGNKPQEVEENGMED
jgi:hypothetical protein